MEADVANVHVPLSPSSRESDSTADSNDFYCVPNYELSPHSIFTVDGKRRKREVKDNFEWLLHPSHPAEVSKALEAYEFKVSCETAPKGQGFFAENP
jgi:hypothetical protein